MPLTSYFPSGEIQIKEEICSFDFCYDSNFINCDNRTTLVPKGEFKDFVLLEIFFKQVNSNI